MSRERLRCLYPMQISMCRSNVILLLRPVYGLCMMDHDGRGVDSAALHRFPEENESFCFLTYRFLSHVCSLMSSARLYRADLNGWDALRMPHVENGALLLDFGLLTNPIAETYLVTRPRISPRIVMELDQTYRPVSSGPLLLQSRLKNPTILQKFKEHHVSYEREI